MKKLGSKLFLLLLLASLFKGLVWVASVPLWQTPDEQAHFAQLQYIVENRTLTVNPSWNLSSELVASEEVLGTRRDARGNNRYTYHPEYNIDYTTTYVGKYELQINSLPISSRTKIVGEEASNYPPLYFALSSHFYNLVYSEGIISRVFSVRLFSLVTNLLLVVFAYRIGRLVWREEFFAIILAIFVSFHPMVSFVSSGVHPDNLLNLLYTAGLYILLQSLKSGVSLKKILLVLCVGLLGLSTKVFMVFFFPFAAAIIVYKALNGGKIGMSLGILLLIFPISVFILRLPIQYVPQYTQNSILADMSFVEYMKFRGPKLLFEIWPWYWGVFKWLGVTLPAMVLKVVTRIAAISFLGIAIRLIQLVYGKRKSWEGQVLLFFLFSTISFALYLIVWDFRSMQSTGFSVGLQGRYFFPNIVPHMALILIGITALLPRKLARLTRLAGAILAILMIILNAVALATIISSYYQVNSSTTLILQISQYKPELFKGLNFLVLLTISAALQISLVFLLIRKALLRRA